MKHRAEQASLPAILSGPPNSPHGRMLRLLTLTSMGLRLSAEANGALCEVGGWFEIRSQVMMWSGRRPYRILYLALFLPPPRVQIGDRVGGSNSTSPELHRLALPFCCDQQQLLVINNGDVALADCIAVDCLPCFWAQPLAYWPFLLLQRSRTIRTW